MRISTHLSAEWSHLSYQSHPEGPTHSQLLSASTTNARCLLQTRLQNQDRTSLFQGVGEMLMKHCFLMCVRGGWGGGGVPTARTNWVCSVWTVSQQEMNHNWQQSNQNVDNYGSRKSSMEYGLIITAIAINFCHSSLLIICTAAFANVKYKRSIGF